MLKHVVIFKCCLFSALCSVCLASPVEYVRICSIYGSGWNYIPGSRDCINPTTGVIKIRNDDGTDISTNSALAARVARLEAQLRQVYSQFGMQLPEENQ